MNLEKLKRVRDDYMFGGYWSQHDKLTKITQAEVVEYLNKVIAEENVFVTVGDDNGLF